MEFKEHLKKKRVEAKLTQKELARISGVSYSYVTKLESGELRNPTFEVLAALSEVLKAPLGAIYDFGEATEAEATKNALAEDTAKGVEQKKAEFVAGFDKLTDDDRHLLIEIAKVLKDRRGE